MAGARYILIVMRLIRMAVVAACASAAFAQPADLVLRNGKIVTMNSAAPVVQAIAVRGDRIIGARRGTPGAAVDRPQYQGHRPARSARHPGVHRRTRPLHRRRRIPHGPRSSRGAHLERHRLPGGARCQTGQARRMDHRARLAPVEMGPRLPSRMSKASPLHESLDKVSPDNPVLLTHASGHAAFVNGKAHVGRRNHARNRQSHRAARSSKMRRAIPPACCASGQRAWLAAREPPPRAGARLPSAPRS